MFQPLCDISCIRNCGSMDPVRNRPSRPRLRSHGNSARVLVFDQADAEDGTSNAEADSTARQPQPPKVVSKEAPVRPGRFSFIITLSKKNF